VKTVCAPLIRSISSPEKRTNKYSSYIRLIPVFIFVFSFPFKTCSCSSSVCFVIIMRIVCCKYTTTAPHFSALRVCIQAACSTNFRFLESGDLVHSSHTKPRCNTHAAASMVAVVTIAISPFRYLAAFGTRFAIYRGARYTCGNQSLRDLHDVHNSGKMIN